jgi:DNA-binding response OmpR family regulator
VRVRKMPRLTRKLLVVDQDAKLLASYRDLLLPYGFEVLTAEDGEVAITIVTEHPDVMLVIVDIMMDGFDSREWIRRVRESHCESPMIVITAARVDGADEMGFSAVLQKPFHVAELLDLVGLFCGLGTPTASASI